MLQTIFTCRWRLADDVLIALKYQPAFPLVMPQAQFVRYQVIGQHFGALVGRQVGFPQPYLTIGCFHAFQFFDE